MAVPEEKVLEVKEQPGAFFYLMSRIDSVDQKLSAKMDRLDEKIDGVEQKLSVKIEAVEDNLLQEFKEEFKELRQEFKEEIGKLDEKIDTLRYWAIGILVVGFGGVVAAIKL
jgi:chromosome segregation ATPase